MLLITCPYCGARPEIEFRCGGEAHIARPPSPPASTMRPGRIISSIRTNPKGVHAERWLHAHGCQRWFNALRDTASDRIVATYAWARAGPTPQDVAGETDGANLPSRQGRPHRPLEADRDALQRQGS